ITLGELNALLFGQVNELLKNIKARARPESSHRLTFAKVASHVLSPSSANPVSNRARGFRQPGLDHQTGVLRPGAHPLFPAPCASDSERISSRTYSLGVLSPCRV